MRTLYFSLLFALFLALVSAGGEAYEATWYGSSEDENQGSELNPSCLDQKYPDTDYYAAVSTKYKKDLCNTYAVVMAVDDDGHHLGKMVKVRIIDSCSECEPSHIDLSKKAFTDIRDKSDGRFEIIWLAADTKGKISRDVIYPSSTTEKFAKNSYGLSKSQFVAMFKKQALDMITNGKGHGTFSKSDVSEAPASTTTRKTTTTLKSAEPTATAKVASATTKDSSTVAPVPSTKETENAAPKDTESPIAGIGDITVVTGETKDKSVPEDAPIVGQTKKVDLQKTNKENKENKDKKEVNSIEKDSPDNDDGGSYTVGVLSAALTVSGAAGIGLLYLKKQSPGKYDEFKQKFPEAFDNIKRSVSRSATNLKRSVTRSVSRNGSKGKTNTSNNSTISRHGEHPVVNYREMPEHMFGGGYLPRIELHDDPIDCSFPETRISI